MIDFEKLDARQRKAFENINNAAIDYIYGLENGCYDTEEGSEEYNKYYRQIQDLESLVDMVYAEAISSVYTGDGGVFGNRYAEAYLRDVRFCGKEFLMEVTRDRCMKYQAEVLKQLA